MCKFIVARVLDWDRAGFLHPLALQDPRAADLLPHLTPDERMRSFHLVEPGGEVFSAEAGLARLADYLPGFPRLAASGYWRVAGNRDRLGRLVPGFLCRQAERRIASRRA